MDNNSLDSFVDNGLKNTQDTSEQIMPRLKLRKIKRPKIRVAPDAPQSPEKIMPEETKQALESDINDGSLENLDNPNESNSIVSINDIEPTPQMNYNAQYELGALPPDYDLSPVDHICTYFLSFSRLSFHFVNGFHC